MAEISYGSHPELLNDLLNRVRAQKGEVEVLNQKESRTLESQSLNLLPHGNWSSIDWENATFQDQFYVDDDAQAAARLTELVQAAKEDSQVIVFWGNLVIPTIKLTAATFGVCVEEIVGTCMDLWVYLNAERLFIEYTHDGRITAAHLP